MGRMIELAAADGHRFGAYEAGLADAARSLVVIQEIFGVNHHIRSVCDGFADAGFHVLAPALFDRAVPGIELGYTPEDVKRGLELRARVPEDGTMADVAACAASLGAAPRGIIGYCWGGTIAWYAACRSEHFAAAVGWYGGGIAAARTETPRCKVQLHFGEQDHGIPSEQVEQIRAAQPEVGVFVYEGAGHGFGCPERASYDARATALAQERSLAFLAHNL